MKRETLGQLVVALAFCASPSLMADDISNNWHQWRGPESNGVSRTAEPPLRWSESKNISWKVVIDGKGGSTPIIWGNKVFLLTAIDTRRVDPSLPKPEDQPDRVFGIKYPNTTHQFVVLCFDRNSGKELWRRIATEDIPHEGHHNDNNFASASPTTDGQRLYCWFGSAGLFCYDLNGEKLWQRDLGEAYVGASLGEGCSPVLHDDKLVIVRDHSRQSTIHVLDAKTGATLWEKNRDEPNAWATPRVVEYNGRVQVITAASNLVRSYDLLSGEIIWQCSGLTGNVIPCPVTDSDYVYCMSGYEGYSLLAMRMSETGNINDSDAVVWTLSGREKHCQVPFLDIWPVFGEPAAMGRPKRAANGGLIYHVLNRANARMTIFEKSEDYAAVERILQVAVDRTETRLLAYCVMPNHALCGAPHKMWLLNSARKPISIANRPAKFSCMPQIQSRRYS